MRPARFAASLVKNETIWQVLLTERDLPLRQIARQAFAISVARGCSAP
jgi:hypothetical protein